MIIENTITAVLWITFHDQGRKQKVLQSLFTPKEMEIHGHGLEK